MKPFSLEFNAAVMTMANRVCPTGYDIGPDAPTSLTELREHVARTGRIKVSNENSDDTIFADAEHNYAFRAWHDWTHWRYMHGFDLAGETNVALAQIRDLGKIFGKAFAEKYKPLILAEVVGQALYKEVTADDQRRFDASFLAQMDCDNYKSARPDDYRL